MSEKFNESEYYYGVIYRELACGRSIEYVRKIINDHVNPELKEVGEKAIQDRMNDLSDLLSLYHAKYERSGVTDLPYDEQQRFERLKEKLYL